MALWILGIYLLGMSANLPVIYSADYTFAKQPSDVIIMGGTIEAVLECQAEPMLNFPWSYNWLRGNQLVHNNSNNRYHSYHRTTKLTISLRNSDGYFFSQGEVNDYRCTATNANGTITSKLARLISGLASPFTDKTQKNLNKDQYEPLVIPSNYQSIPGLSLSINWKKKMGLNSFQAIEFGNDGRRSVALNGDIVFSNLLLLDNLNYTCEATLVVSGDIRRSRGSLNVLTVNGKACSGSTCDRPLTVIRTSNSIVAGVLGRDASLECIPGGRPTPVVSWCIYNPFNYQCRPIVSDNSKYLLQFGNRRLLIRNIGYQDRAIYRCVMKLNSQEQRRDINLIIHTLPTWSNPLTYTTASIEDRFTWPCIAVGTPPITYRWYRNGSEILRNDRRFTFTNSYGNIIFNKLETTDIGVYQCQATNQYGTIFSSGYLLVRSFGVIFTKPFNQNQLIQTGQIGEFECLVDGGPKPTMIYRYNGSVIQFPSSKYTALSNGNLRIHNVAINDTGSYQCTATNRFTPNPITSTASLRVYERTRIIHGPVNRNYRIQESATLPCNVTSDFRLRSNIQVVWYRNNVTIQTNPIYRLTEQYPNYQLRIINGIRSISGNFTCTVTATIPGLTTFSDSKTATILFNDVPVAPSLQSINRISNTMANMTWEFPANGDNGSPLREFLIEYKSDFYDQVRVFQRISDTAARYAILNFSPWVIYQLRVVAVNGIGRNTTNSFLTFSTKAITNVPTGKVENLYSRIRGSARNALNIFWKPLSREDENGPNIGYQIRYRLSSANLFTSYRRLGNVSTTFISQLLPNEFYDIQIQAYNRDGVSATIATIKACTCITAPSQGPTNVTSVVISDAVRISWNEIPAHHTGGNLKGYKIRFRSDTTPPRTYNGDVGLVTKYDLRGLAINVRYFLTVRGYNDAGDSQPSTQILFTAGSKSTIYTPTGLRPVSVNHNNATVQWVIQGSPASFILQYRSSSQSAWSNSTTISGSSRDGIYTNLKAKTQYDLRVVAHYFTLAISPSSSIAISTSDAPVGEQRPFYQQVWFIILVAISGIVLVLIIICSLVMKSRKSERHSGVSHVNSLKDRVPPRPPSPKDENNEIEDAKRPPLPQEAPVIHEYKELEHIDDGSSHDSLDQYGSEHVTGCFDEDGSFIDQYGTTQSKYSGSQHVLHRSASVGSSAFSTLV